MINVKKVGMKQSGFNPVVVLGDMWNPIAYASGKFCFPKTVLIRYKGSKRKVIFSQPVGA